jgi:hypothetical protein
MSRIQLWGLLLSIFLLPGSGFSETTPIPPWNSNSISVWWQQNPLPDKWKEADASLQSQLAAIYQRNGSAAFNNPDFQQWLRHLQWLQIGISAGNLLNNDANRETFIALGKDDTVSHLFAEKFLPVNSPRPALENLIRIAQANMNDLHEYAALGVAYALVFDKAFPKYWPHPQVDHKAVPIDNADVVPRFAFYVDANRQNKLAQDISKLNFDELKFMVDSLVSLEELRYGQSNKSNRINYSNFDQAFSSIQYDYSRIRGNKLFDWPESNGAYTLQNIEQKGGICVDQAYYAAALGKARGIPTLYFSGQGSDGGHAWFGYLQRNGRWNLDCGRYANQNYPVGYAFDPQTWQELNDVTLQNIARNISHDDKFEAAQTGLAWAKLNANSPDYPKILQDTISIMPELAEAWEAKGDWLDKNSSDNNAKREFYESWVKQFSANRDFIDMKVEGQSRLLALLKELNDPAAEQLQNDIVSYNRKKRFDLGIGAGASELSEKLEAKDWNGARQEYEKMVRSFNQQGGGNLFYQVVRPYVQFCIEEKQIPQARQGLKYAQSRMSVSSDSILAMEFSKLNEAIKAAQSNSTTAAGSEP